MDDGIRPDRGPHQLGQGFLILAGEDDDIELEAHLRLIDEDKGVAHLGQELFEILAREAKEDGGAPLLGASGLDHDHASPRKKPPTQLLDTPSSLAICRWLFPSPRSERASSLFASVSTV